MSTSNTAVTAEHEANLRPLIMLISLPQRHVNRNNFSKIYKYVNKSVVMNVSGVTTFPHSFAIEIGSIKYSSAGESSGVRMPVPASVRRRPSAARCGLAARWLRTGRATLPAPLCLLRCYAPGACVAPPRSRMKGRNITSICNSLRQIDINGDGFNKV